MIRILLADHNVHSLWALRTMLGEQHDVEVVGSAERGEDLVQLAGMYPVDVILVDRMLPGLSLIELMANLHAVQPSSFVIVVGAHAEYGRSAMHAGADAFVSKSDDPAWLLDRIRSYTQRWRQ